MNDHDEEAQETEPGQETEPEGQEAEPEGREAEPEGRESARPTGWITLAVVCALAAVGFGIWGASKSSQLAEKKQQLAKQERSAAQAKTEELLVAKTEDARYRALRATLVRTEKGEVDFKAEAAKESQELAQARRELAGARTTEEKQAAKLKTASAQSRVAIVCAKGTVDAIGEFMVAGAASRKAAERTMNKLEALQPQCQAVLNRS